MLDKEVNTYFRTLINQTFMYIIFNDITGRQHTPEEFPDRDAAIRYLLAYDGDDELSIRPKYARYKVWVHLEEIATDAEGNDLSYESLDEDILPMPLGNFSCKDNAIGFMNDLYDQNYDPNINPQL